MCQGAEGGESVQGGGGAEASALLGGNAVAETIPRPWVQNLLLSGYSGWIFPSKRYTKAMRILFKHFK